MSNQELFQALKMFTDGANELSTSLAIHGANEQVQQIKANVANEAEQRAALQGVSNNLVAHMAALGTPATTIQAVARALGPKQYANANEMYKQGLLTGNQQLQDMAEKQQTFEVDLEDKLALAAAKRNPLLAAQMQEKKNEFMARQLSTFSKTLDDTEAVRNAFGKTGQGIQRANQIDALVGKAQKSINDMNALSPQMVNELATATASLVKGGATPTDNDVKHFMVNNIGMSEAQAKQYLTNGVSGANAGEFVNLYLKTAHRERAELQAQAEDTVLKRAQGNLKLYKMMEPEDQQQFKQTIADRIGGISADDVIIDPKKGTVTTKDKMQRDSDTDMATTYLKKAYGTLQNPGASLDEKTKAMEVYKRLGVDPKTPLRQSLLDVQYKVSRGLL